MTDTNNTETFEQDNAPSENASDKEAQAQASEFIANTSLEDMIAIADEAARRKREERAAEGPKWVFPEGGIQPE